MVQTVCDQLNIKYRTVHTNSSFTRLLILRKSVVYSKNPNF